MDERLRFVARLLEGDKMAVLCREFGISRKTGYKLYRRYRDCGLDCQPASRIDQRPASDVDHANRDKLTILIGKCLLDPGQSSMPVKPSS
jgi:transposase